MDNGKTIELPFFCSNSDLPGIVSIQHGQGSLSVFSTRCPGKETVNEDSIAVVSVTDRHLVCLVADGLGGQPSGDQASALTIRLLAKRIQQQADSASDLMQVILRGMEDANDRLLGLSTGLATTLAIAEIRDGAVRTYHVGDSMILVTGQRGRIKLETISHSPVGYAVEAGLVEEQDSLHHDERHIVSNVIGSQDMHTSIGAPVSMAPRDTLLIASDGLFDNLHKEEIMDIIRKGDLHGCAGQLRDRARKRMLDHIEPWKPDDLSFILFRPKPDRR
ncbi:MAG: protein phosphatase 2C domain-containing protein [Thiotrichales bacterium]|nr:protein phosphatase 2C domain-containing protein [Thiotrichales bacterium]